MNTNIYTTLTFNAWQDFKHFVDSLSENWAFRGQFNTRWVLKNAIERTEFIKLNKNIEFDFLHDFQRGARNYLSKDETPEHVIEWLALMQHHGAPTRLLDFSKSPYIAAYFAFEQCSVRHEHAIAIWAININYLKNKSIELLSAEFSEHLKVSNNLINEALFEKIFFQNRHSMVFPVEPFRMNRRYSLQQSIFVSTGNSSEPFIKQLECMGNEMNRAVIKIEMPAGLQKEVLRDLQRMNLNRASLFPDLDGYAIALKYRYNSMKTPEEFVEQQIQLLQSDDYSFFP